MAIEKILVVDDEEIMRDFLVETLKRKGLDAVSAENGEKAIQLIEQESFDLIITDMKMSKMYGLDVLHAAKKISPRSLVIIVTAFGTIENAVEAIKAGAFHYLIKPFSIE